MVLFSSTIYLTDFLPLGSVNYLFKGVEVSNYNSGYVYFFLKFYHVLFQLFDILSLSK